MYCSCLEGVDWSGSVYRDGVWKTKAHSKLNLARVTRNNKNGFYRSTSCKRNIVEYGGCWLSRAGYLGTREEDEALSVSFPLSLLEDWPSAIPGPWHQGEWLEQGRLTLIIGSSVLGTFKQTVHVHIHGPSWWVHSSIRKIFSVQE